MGRVEGKVAVVTGAARGQGRSHAWRLAQEGADVIALDLCADIPSNDDPLATPEDLDETARGVQRAGRRVVARRVDVRDRAALGTVVAEGVEELGGLHVVVANAGICPLGPGRPMTAFVDAVDVDLVGAINTVHACLPHLTTNASIMAIGSVTGLIPSATSQAAPLGPGGAGYALAKRSIVEYVNALARQLAPHSMRANAIHPTNCNTDMLHSTAMYRTFRPDLDDPTPDEARVGFHHMQAMPVPWVEPEDVSHAVIYLASDESRYITGLQLKVDAGALLKAGV